MRVRRVCWAHSERKYFLAVSFKEREMADLGLQGKRPRTAGERPGGEAREMIACRASQRPPARLGCSQRMSRRCNARIGEEGIEWQRTLSLRVSRLKPCTPAQACGVEGKPLTCGISRATQRRQSCGFDARTLHTARFDMGCIGATSGGRTGRPKLLHVARQRRT